MPTAYPRQSLQSYRRRTAVGGALLALGMLGACATARDATAPAGTRRVIIAADSNALRFTIPRRVGQISADSLARIAGRVASLRAEPSLLTMRVGDSVSLHDRLRIIAIDSGGTELGELYGYDFSPRGPLWLVRDGRIWARELGTAEFHASFPQRLWKGDRAGRPTVVVPILISAVGTTSPPIAPAVP